MTTTADPTADQGLWLDQLCREREAYRLPPRAQARASTYAEQVLGFIFPHFAAQVHCARGMVAGEHRALAEETATLLAAFQQLAPDGERSSNTAERSAAFMDSLPALRRSLLEDAQFIVDSDSAATSIDEVVLSYPGFLATACYRVAHRLRELGVPLLPRLITEYAHQRTGIDIHPGATIGVPFAIDHGTGVVIGETAYVGRRVRMYQGVTLGALSVEKGLASNKRHPTIHDDVVLYANATVLGGRTTVGAGSIIGGNVWLTRSVAEKSVVVHKAMDTHTSDQPALDWQI